MYLAERPRPTGAFDLEALALPAIGRVLRYAIVGATAGGRRVWQQQPDAYAIGFSRNVTQRQWRALFWLCLRPRGRDGPLVVRRLPMVDGRGLPQFPRRGARPASVADRRSAYPRPTGRGPAGRTGPATRRRSRAISSATSTNPRMTLRGARSATSRSSARASRQLTPASLRRQPRPLFCRPALPRRRRSSPARRVRRPRLLARRLQNPRGRLLQLRPGRRLRPSPAAPIRCAASAPACRELSCPRPGF